LQDQASVCCTCLQDEDTIDHILVQCSYARQIWYDCIHAAGLEMEEPHAISQLEYWWTEARSSVQKRDRRRLESLVILVAWMLWKQRNARVFGNTRNQCDTRQLTERIEDGFRMWKLTFIGGRNHRTRE
jgi:hypothetical protein